MRLITIFILFSWISVFAEEKKTEVVFEGLPVKKIEVTESVAATYEVVKTEREKYKVVIVKVGNKYFWKSRGNLEVIPMKSGVYITYLSVTGSGYVRVLNEEMRKLLSMLSEKEKAKNYKYFEHLVHQMGSITYYGR